MGKPKKKEKQVAGRVSAEEHAKLCNAAQSKGVTVYEFTCDLLSVAIAELPNVAAVTTDVTDG